MMMALEPKEDTIEKALSSLAGKLGAGTKA